MNEAEKEIFEYFTKNDNFRLAFDIHEQFSWVRNKLVRDFWQAVATEIGSRIKNDEWKLVHEDPFQSHGKVGLYVPDAGYLGLVYENLDGEVLLALLADPAEYDHDLLRKALSGTSLQHSTNPWWIRKKDCADDFSAVEHLEALAKGEGPDKVKRYADELWTLAEEIRPSLYPLESY